MKGYTSIVLRRNHPNHYKSTKTDSDVNKPKAKTLHYPTRKLSIIALEIDCVREH